MHRAIGGTAKAAPALCDRWVKAVRGQSGIEVLTPDDPALHAGITSFRMAGRTSLADNQALRKQLFDRHRIFTAERNGPAKGACIRVTPSLVNAVADVDALFGALGSL
jgi:isopenicillin-N epimerase